MIHDDELNEIIRKLDLAKSISEFHFRDAVRELIEECATCQACAEFGAAEEEQDE